VTIELLGKKIVLKIDSSSASVNDKTVSLDSPATIIKSTGRTVVPVRFVSETFNSHVSWDDQTKAAIIEFSPDWLTKNVTVELYYPVTSGAPIAKNNPGLYKRF
jgi:multiple sugar transport system substrate-binding protein